MQALLDSVKASNITKLKHIEKIQEDKKKKVHLEELDIDIYENTILDYNIECWYPLLKHCTFPTIFMPISIDDALLIQSVYKDNNKFSQLDELINKLSNIIMNSEFNSDSMFVKSSSRSAKDYGILTKELIIEYKRLLLSEKNNIYKQKQCIQTNTKIILLLTAATTLLQFQCTNDKTESERISINIFKAFTKSERIYSDYEIALKHQNIWTQNIILRKWIDLDITLEFRCFVLDNDMVGISQYNDAMCIPYLTDSKLTVEEKLWRYNYIKLSILRHFKSHVQPILKDKYNNYVIDYAFTKKFSSLININNKNNNNDDILSNDMLIVIELNPYMPTTDGGLFSWTEDILHIPTKKEKKDDNDDDNDNCDFRILDEPPLGSLGRLLDDWKNLIISVDKEEEENNNNNHNN